MVEFKVEIEIIENGILVKIDSKGFYCKNSYHVGRLLIEEIDKFLDEIDNVKDKVVK